MLEPVVVLFVVSVLLALVLVFRGVNVTMAILVAFLAYSIPTLGSRLPWVLLNSFNETLVNTVLALVSALFLANLYKSHPVSEKLVKALRSIGVRLAGALIPAVIGLLPMPAGAYVSAVMVDGVYEELGLSRVQRTFINYWFRHIWLSVWPLYQGVILAAGILGTSVMDVVSYTWPIMVSSLVSGAVIAITILPRKTRRRSSSGEFSGLAHIWPFVVLPLLAIFGRIPLFIAVLATAALFVAVYRVPRDIVFKSAIKSLDVSLVGLIVLSMFFSSSVEATNLASYIASLVGGYNKWVLIFLVPFALVLATGFEFTFVALAFPVLKPFLSGAGLTVAYLSGFVGAMLSPSHACLVLSSKYFNTKLPSVYKYLVPSAMLTVVLTLLLSVALFH